MNFPCFAGCKCKKLFQLPQAFSNLFSENFFPFDSCLLPEFLRAFFAVAGAKVEPFSASASFFIEFFSVFFDLFLNSLITVFLQSGYFRISVGFFFLCSAFSYFMGVLNLPFYWIFTPWCRFQMIFHVSRSFFFPKMPLWKPMP